MTKKDYKFTLGYVAGLACLIISIVLIKSDNLYFGFVLFLLGCIISYRAFRPAKRRQKQKNILLNGQTQQDEYSIKGINFRGIDDTMLGDFEGYVRALKSNQYDSYAIGVYIGSRKVGYLPRGNKDLHRAIMLKGGTTAANGYIAKDIAEDGRTFYYGKVRVLDV